MGPSEGRAGAIQALYERRQRVLFYQDLPVDRGPDCRQDVGKWAVLRQEPGGACRGCRREPGGRGVCGKDQDTDLRAGSLDLPCGFDAVGTGQPDVHQHGVGMASDRQRDGFLGRSRGAHAVHIGLSAYRDLQGAGERLLVLYHQHPGQGGPALPRRGHWAAVPSRGRGHVLLSLRCVRSVRLLALPAWSLTVPAALGGVHSNGLTPRGRILGSGCRWQWTMLTRHTAEGSP